jgi:hypothetical protein
MLGFAGCNSAPPPQLRADYSVSLDRYYQGRPLCLWPDAVSFPVVDATPDQIDERGLNALVDTGLLVRTRASRGARRGSYTYDLSPEGRSAIDRDIFNKSAGNFCYGRRTVTSVDAQRRNSSSTELVDYHIGVTGRASWASEHSIQSAFPQVARDLDGEHKAEVTLINTIDGWVVSGTPANIAPMTTPPNASALARAKAMLVP